MIDNRNYCADREDDFIDEHLLTTYITETKEQIERLVLTLLQLESDPDRQMEYIDEMFRIAHNIKGSSGMVGLPELKQTMHEMENLFDAVRDQRLFLDPAAIDLLLSLTDDLISFLDDSILTDPFPEALWVDKLRTYTTEPSADRRKRDIPLILNKDEKVKISSWQEAGKFVYGIKISFSLEMEMRSVISALFLRLIRNYGEIIKTAPLEDELAEEDYNQFNLVLLREVPFKSEDEEYIRSYPVHDGVKEINIRKWEYRKEESAASYKERSIEAQTIRVEMGRVDNLINDVGKMLTLKTTLLHIYHQGYQGKVTWRLLGEFLQELEHVVSSLQSRTMDLRMAPVRQIFARFPKIIRDTAKQCGKRVELHFSGEETEIDKQVAEELIDPLTHLLRNSVDHGLEDPAERARKGKDNIGHITLSARQEGSSIVVSVSDDGRGLNLKEIRKKAITAGLIDPSASLRDDEISHLIFSPGFSTATEVSDVSGRGVGLDVVKTSLKRLQGDIEVQTKPDLGATFNLRVPLTLAIIQSFLVKISGQVFGIPVGDVVQSIVIKASEIHRVGDKIIYYRYPETIPLIDLETYLNLSSPCPKDLILVVITNYGRGRVGFIVEELLGLEEIMIKPINKSMREVREISGAALLGTGDIALMLDIQSIAENIIHQ